VKHALHVIHDTICICKDFLCRCESGSDELLRKKLYDISEGLRDCIMEIESAQRYLSKKELEERL